jgi:hypothetical protein
VAFLDPLVDTDRGTRPVRIADQNNTIQSFNQLDPPMAWGVAASVGYMYDEFAVEAAGFYIPFTGSSVTTNRPGQVDVNFINAPPGFNGDNGLFLQADQVRTRQETQLADGELNIRYVSRAFGGFEPFIGVRYFDVQERLSIFTDNDGLTATLPSGLPDPTLQATYAIKTHSHIVAPQLGVDLEAPICTRVAVSLVAKGAWGVNFFEKETSLMRGDGLVGFDSRSSHTQFSHLYQLGFNLDYYLLEQMRLRAGYNLLWVVNVPEADQQVDFNLQHTNGNRSDHGNIFFHGPTIEVQFLF